ncbi:unknown protein [Stanieria sp. NIES-3757]|nr:unknown protein [Stanieria sp. NIES-3757]
MTARIRWQTSLLATTCLSITLLTIYSWLSPTAGKREVKAFTFPNQIPLNSWQLVTTKSLPLSNFKTLEQSDRITAAKHYSYFKNDIPLEIEMRYLVGTQGNIIELINQQKSISKQVLENADLEEIPGIGYYILFDHDERAYLSACINSRGNTTVTPQQFSHNRYSQDLSSSLILPWLQGKDSLRDIRCLWVELSIPIKKSTTSTAYQTLTKAWIDWYYWWQPRFPSL